MIAVRPSFFEGGPAEEPASSSTLRRQVLLVAIFLFATAGVVFGVKGTWIFCKAKVAQTLLEMSWQSRAAGGGVWRPWPWADTKPVARLRLERTGESIIILDGASGRTMAFGPGHLDGSSLPGERGNSVVTAHRDTHFAALRDVRAGDRITIERLDGARVEYRVRLTAIIDESDTNVTRQDAGTRLTLITCYPFDAITPGGRLRYVVIAEA